MLADNMLDQVNRELSNGSTYKAKKFSISAKNLIVQHSWPGNAREMINTIMRACVWCEGDMIQDEDVRQSLLPFEIKKQDDILQQPLGGSFALDRVIGLVSSEYIRRALAETAGNKSKASKLLGFKSYQTLDNWMKRYAVEV